jgi:U4/U6.U5 tri-snRNP-associated protein 1
MSEDAMERIQRVRAKRKQPTETSSTTKDWVQSLKKNKTLVPSSTKGTSQNVTDDGDTEVLLSHGIDEFEEGKQVILTLKDEQILEKKGIAISAKEEDLLDQLEDIEKVEQRKTEKNLKRKEQLKNKRAIAMGVYDDGSQKGILSKYDEEDDVLFGGDAGTRMMKISTSSSINTAEIVEKQKLSEEMKRRIAAGISSSAKSYSLDVEKKLDSEYLGQTEEPVKIKKSEKRSKNKRKPIALTSLSDFAENQLSENLNDDDHGSRSDALRIKERNESHSKELVEKLKNYNQALEKSERLTKQLEEKHLAETKKNSVTEFEDVEEQELESVLEKARRAAQMRSNQMSDESFDQEEKMLKAIQQAKQHQLEFENKIKNEDRIVFSSSVQFVGALDSLAEDEEEIKGEQSQEIAVKNETEEVVLNHEEDVVMGNQNNPESSSEESESEELFRDEPLVNRGLGTTLALIKSRGLLGRFKPLKSGRANDEFEEDDTDANGIKLDKFDEFGRKLTKKQAFRELSYRFHGQTAGISKRERAMKDYQKQLKSRKLVSTSSSSVPSSGLQKLQKASLESGNAYLILDSKAIASGTASIAKQKF